MKSKRWLSWNTVTSCRSITSARNCGVHFYVMKLIEGKNLRELVHTLKSAVSRKKQSTELPAQTKQATPVHGDSTHDSGWSKGDTLASNDVLDEVSREGSTAHPHFVKCLVRMGIQISTALHHVHQQGVVHRDIKPANLLLDVDGDVWLTDFGLAMIRDNPSLTAPGDLVGTFHYMSPEQAMGSKRVIVDHRSDIYSLGVTLYELLTLKRAFPGRTREQILRSVQFDNPLPVRKIAPRVPTDLETIVMKAMAKDPNARFQSAAELAAELKRFQDGKPLTIRPPSVLEQVWLLGTGQPSKGCDVGGDVCRDVPCSNRRCDCFHSSVWAGSIGPAVRNGTET